WNHHVQAAACCLLDAPVSRPGALLELELSPLDVEGVTLCVQRLQLDEEPARLVARPHHRERRGEQRPPEPNHRELHRNAHAATFSATRMIALRDRKSTRLNSSHVKISY